MLVEGGSHRLAEQKNPEMDLRKFSPLIFAKSTKAAQQQKVSLLAKVLGNRSPQAKVQTSV